MNHQISTDSLFELRLAWIKSVSRIWSEASDDSSMFSNELVKENFNEYSENSFGAMGVLNHFNLFNNPWQIELHIKTSEKAPYWNPGDGTYQVSNPQEIEQVLIYIPDAPAENATQAIADYYASAPSIFGFFGDSNSNAGDVFSLANSENNAISTPSNDFSANSSSRFSIGANTGTMYEFGAMLADAVSLSWINKEFRNSLVTENPLDKDTKNINVDMIGKAQKALKEAFNYDFPWNFDLIIAVDDKAEYKKDDQSGTGFKWSTNKCSRLVLVVPEAPKSLNDYGPIALASYNAGGARYPFSCG